MNLFQELNPRLRATTQYFSLHRWTLSQRI
jgi:hypothetical protein